VRRLVPTLSLTSILLVGLMAPSAVAGGNWLEFRSAERDPRPSPSRWDIFTVGETVVAKVGYLDGSLEAADGPFHLWIERGQAVEAGSPIPSDAIRVATFDMSADGRGGRAVFELPALPSGLHSFAVCDDPCTARGFGFGEFVQGWLSVVQTPQEGRLLARVRELREAARTKLRDSRADLRVAELQGARLTDRLNTALGALEESRAQVERLTRSASGPHEQVLIDGAVGALIAFALVIAALIIRRRRSPRIGVPDSPAELLSPSERVLEDLNV
jgi:hypothetical protein